MSKNVTPAVKTAAKSMKVAKPNPSANLIGKSMTSTDPISVNYRKGKTNIIACHEIVITGANATGRRLTVDFKDSAGTVLMTRRVYKEHVEEMAWKFNVDLDA
jgi:hypothetical protein